MTTYLRAFTEAQLLALQAQLGSTHEAHAAACRPVNGEALCMPIVCTGWEKRAAGLELPRKGAKREQDREAYMQGALAALVAAGLMTVERANQLAFMTAVGRLGQYMEAQAAKDTEPA